MKIAFDTSPLGDGHKGRGVGTYTRELANTLKKHPSSLEIVLTPEPRSEAADIIHYPYFDLFFPSLPLIHQAKTIVTVHDVIPLEHPDYFPIGVKGSLNLLRQKWALSRVNHVITDSQASKKSIHRYLGVPKEKISVVYLAASDAFTLATPKDQDRVREKFQLPEKYLLFVGALSYNKNLHTLINAIASLNSIPLYVITRTNLEENLWEKQTALRTELIKKALSELPTKDLVQFIKVDDGADFQALYSAAHAYIQPSVNEGFGLPILEAMKSQTLVLSSKAGSLPEVAGEGVLYFDPYSSQDIARAISQSLKLTPEKRHKLIAKSLTHAQTFSWQKTAAETIKVYEQVI